MTASALKNTCRRLGDAALYFLFCFLLGTGLLLKFSYVKGRLGKQTVMGLVKHDWVDLHLYAGIAMAAILLVHLWFNRVWLRQFLCKKRAAGVWIFLGLGIALVLALALWPTHLQTAG